MGFFWVSYSLWALSSQMTKSSKIVSYWKSSNIISPLMVIAVRIGEGVVIGSCLEARERANFLVVTRTVKTLE